MSKSEIDRLRPVVEAAMTWRGSLPGDGEDEHEYAVVDAVDAYRQSEPEQAGPDYAEVERRLRDHRSNIAEKARKATEQAEPRQCGTCELWRTPTCKVFENYPACPDYQPRASDGAGGYQPRWPLHRRHIEAERDAAQAEVERLRAQQPAAVEAGPEPASPLPWRHDKSQDCDGNWWITVFDGEDEIATKDAGRNAPAIVHRVNNWGRLCAALAAEKKAHAETRAERDELTNHYTVLSNALTVATDFASGLQAERDAAQAERDEAVRKWTSRLGVTQAERDAAQAEVERLRAQQPAAKPDGTYCENCNEPWENGHQCAKEEAGGDCQGNWVSIDIEDDATLKRLGLRRAQQPAAEYLQWQRDWSEDRADEWAKRCWGYHKAAMRLRLALKVELARSLRKAQQPAAELQWRCDNSACGHEYCTIGFCRDCPKCGNSQSRLVTAPPAVIIAATEGDAEVPECRHWDHPTLGQPNGFCRVLRECPHHDNESELRSGTYDKFEVRRRDGTSQRGCKHERCDYFVLDWVHDQYAAPAMCAYATACEKRYPALAADIRQRAQRAIAEFSERPALLRCCVPGCERPAMHGGRNCKQHYEEERFHQTGKESAPSPPKDMDWHLEPGENELAAPSAAIVTSAEVVAAVERWQQKDGNAWHMEPSNRRMLVVLKGATLHPAEPLVELLRACEGLNEYDLSMIEDDGWGDIAVAGEAVCEAFRNLPDSAKELVK